MMGDDGRRTYAMHGYYETTAFEPVNENINPWQ